MSTNKRARYITPRELRDDNTTPINIGLLAEYMDVATDACVELLDLRRDLRNKSTLIQAGTRAIPTTPRQPSNDEVTVLAQRPKAAEELLKIVNSALRKAKKSKLKFPKGKRKADGINLKAVEKIGIKANKEYSGDISRVVDMVRCTILADNIEDLQKLSEIFRPCANPDVIRFRNEFNRVNPEKGNIRRLQINIAMPEADGHVGEILVFYGPSAAKYDISREAYGKQRTAQDAINRSSARGTQSQEALVIAGKIAEEAGEKRKKANEEAANFPEVRGLVMNQSAYEINQFPVIVNDDGHQGKRFALVPNPVSGFWETDQRFLDIIDNRDDYPDLKVNDLSIYQARVHAEALCRNERIKTAMIADRSPGPTPEQP